MEAPKATPEESTSKADSESGQESEDASEDRAWRLMDLLQTQNRTSYRPILPKPTNIEIEQSLAKEQSRVEEQRQMKHQKWVEYQRQVDYQRWAEYQQRVEVQKCQTVQNAAALEARNIMQPYHLRSFPALLSWDAYHRYPATNVAALEARDIVQPDPESSSNHSSWNANQGHAAALADADSSQPASDSMDSQAEDQGHHVADNLAVLDGMDVVRSYPVGRSCYPSPPTGNPVHDIHTSPYFGDALSRASRTEGFTTMEELLEYERHQYPSIRYFEQPVRNPVTGMWTILDLPIVQCRPLAGKAEDEFDMPGLVEGTDMPLAPRGEGSARPDRGLHRV